MTAMVAVEVSVTPLHVTDDQLIDITGVVRNTGGGSLDTQVWRSQLLVDGLASEEWSWAIANGFRDQRESSLPPGQQVTFRRVLPSSVLLTTGTHEVVLQVLDVRSRPVIVERA